MATSATTTTTLQRTPAKPFYFNTSAHLLRITKYKANSLAELLDALRECPEDSVFQLEQYLKGDPKVCARAADETFYFCASDIVVLPTSFEGRTMHEFTEGLRRVSVHSIHHHFIEARLRLKLMSNDFSQWLHEDVGLTEAARKLNRIDIYTATLEDVRQQIVQIVERALT